MDPSYPLLPVINFLCAVLVLIPLPWLFAHWNTGAWMYALWVSLSCITHGINVIVWKDNVDIVVPVWCDITSRIFIGQSIAIPAASLAITRRIYTMFSLRGSLSRTRREKLNAVVVDLSLTLGLPLLNTVLYYIVQGHRFNIIEEFGCAPTVVNTWLTFILVYTWPLVIGLTSCIYCVLIIRIYLKRRRNLSKLDSPTNFSRYHRVLALGCVDAVITVPCSIFLIYANAVKDGPVLPWTGWADIHYNLSRIDRFPSSTWRLMDPLTVAGLLWNAWVSPACAVVFFGFFGLTREVREGYAQVLVAVGRKLGFSRFIKKVTRGGRKRETTLDGSEFRVASVHGTAEHETHDISLASTTSSASTIDMAGQQENTLECNDESELKYKIPPLGKDVMKRIDPHWPADEQV